MKLFSNGIPVIAGAITLVTSLTAQATFTFTSFVGIGDLPGGGVISGARGVSGDGSKVVGYSNAGLGNEAVVYENGVLTALGELAGGYYQSVAEDISADGTTIVGSSQSAGGKEGFIYQNGVMTGIGFLPGGTQSELRSVSANGAVSVGGGDTVNGGEAFRYENNALVGLGDLPGGSYSSWAVATSDDASTFVGISASENFNPQAFRYENGEMIGLGDIPDGENFTMAYDTSSDGSIIVGEAEIDSPGLPSRIGFIHKEGAYSLLDSLENSTFVHVRGVSGDGQRIVGTNRVSGDSPGDGAAVLWDAESLAIFSIQEGLYAAGIDLAAEGWDLNQANAISADGTTIVGYGSHNGFREGWVVTLAASTAIPVPATAWLFGSALIGLIGLQRRS